MNLEAVTSPVPKSTVVLFKFLAVIAELLFAVAADALNALINAALCVCAAPDNALSPATYSALNAVAIEEDKELLAVVAKPLIASLCVCAEALNAASPATYSVLKAPAADPEYVLNVEVNTLFPILVAIEAEKLGSSFKAAANSSKVSNVSGAELTIPATFASI